MTSYYEVLRPVEQSDLDAHPGFADVFAVIPRQGIATFEMCRDIEKDHASRGMSLARNRGILKRISPHSRILKLKSVKFWQTQLNESGHRNMTPRHSTRELYLGGLSKFDEWLSGRTFQSYEILISGRRAIQKSFENVEELQEYCDVSDYGIKTARHAVMEYLAGPQASKMSDSAHSITRSAINSYFNVNYIQLGLPSPKKRRREPDRDDDNPMTIEEFYKILQNGKPSLMMRAVMMIKLQSGMDSATLADRFNHDGYGQLVKCFKTADHSSWDLGMCPVLIKTVRVKTDVRYTTFLDRDAIAQLKEYLT